jgi:hypothetical protein
LHNQKQIDTGDEAVMPILRKYDMKNIEIDTYRTYLISKTIALGSECNSQRMKEFDIDT